MSPGINPIHVWAGLRTELIWIYEGLVHPLNRRRQTDHSQGYWVWLMQQGSVEVKFGRRVLRAQAGDCLVTPHGLMQQTFSDDARILSLHFSCQWPTGERLFVESGGLVFRLSLHPVFLAKARGLARLVGSLMPVSTDVHFTRQAVPFSSFLLLQRLFTEWLQTFSETLVDLGYTYSAQNQSTDSRLLHAVRCMKEAPLSSEFPAEPIRQETGLGRSQLDRLFLQAFGMTTRSYWNRRKLESAKALLTTTVSPIKELGFRLGFKQASHFTKWFHTQTGLNPAAFRTREGVAVRASGPVPPSVFPASRASRR